MDKKFRPVFVVTGIMIVICLICVLLMIVLTYAEINWEDDFFYLVYSIPLLIFAIIFLLVMIASKEKYVHGSEEIEAGNYLARWSYAKDEWDRFNLDEWKRLRKKAMMIPSIFAAIFLLMMLMANELTDDEMFIVFWWTLGFTGFMIFFTMLYGYRTYKKNFLREREVFVGLSGIRFGGIYTAWDLPGGKLNGAKVIPGNPPMIEFQIKMWARYGYRTNSMRIPVPAGREEEANNVIEKLLSMNRQS